MLLPSIFNDNVFDDFMDGFDSFMDRSALYGKHGKNLMKTDVRDVGDHYELDMDLPGFKKDEIHAELENEYTDTILPCARTFFTTLPQLFDHPSGSICHPAQ